MCCKFFIIPDVDKKKNEWCRHCRLGSSKPCQIYDRRPTICRDFECGWKDGERIFGNEWYPKRSHMVIVPGDNSLLIKVDPGIPNAWRQEPYHSQILQWSWKILVWISVGDELFLVKRGWEQEKEYDAAKEEKTAYDDYHRRQKVEEELAA